MGVSRRMLRGLLAPLVASLVLLGLLAVPVGADAATPAALLPGSHGCSETFYQGDRRLGPAVLSNQGLAGFELIGYQRTGALTPAAFLATYYDPTANSGAGGWIYPPSNGYALLPNGQPIEWQQPLLAGQYIDRYGSEYGAFLSPTGLPYPTRAIPPSNLVSTPADTCNYHDYKVVRSFRVDAGPIASWFAQPGGGIQYQLDGTLVPGAPASINVMWLVNAGYLQRV